MATGIDYDSPSKMIDGSNWHERQQALHAVLRRYSLSDPKVQLGVIELFKRETGDPNWGDLDEDLNYENYYEELSNLCQKIAQAYHNPAAWHTLVYSVYNADSVFGRWLIEQPEAVPILLEMLQSKEGGWVNLAKDMTAEMIARCSRPNVPNCSAVLARRDEVLAGVRKDLLEPFPRPGDPAEKMETAPSEPGLAPITPWRVTTAITFLGTCGNDADLALLDKLAARYRAEKIDPNDTRALGDRDSALGLIRMSEQQINRR